LKYYENYNGSIDIFQAAALAGTAGYYASKNEYQKAAGLYKEAASVAKINAQNPDYLLDAAINYYNAGDNEEAKVLLEKIKEDYASSEANKQVDRYLALVE